MNGLLIRWAVNALSLFIVGYLVPGVTVHSIFHALLAAVILGVMNAVIRPLMIFFTLPLTLLSLGLFILVINGLIFWMAASLTPGLTIEGFWSALFGSLILSLVSWLANSFIADNGRWQYIELKKGPDGRWS